MMTNIVIANDITTLFKACGVQLSFQERFGPIGIRSAIKTTIGAITILKYFGPTVMRSPVVASSSSGYIIPKKMTATDTINK